MIYFFVISIIFALWVWFLGGGDRLESFHALPKLLTFLMGIDGRSIILSSASCKAFSVALVALSMVGYFAERSMV